MLVNRSFSSQAVLLLTPGEHQSNPPMAKYTLSQLLKDEYAKQLPHQEELDLVQDKSCSGRTVSRTDDSLPEQLLSGGRKHWVETYSPSKRKGYTYYRYVWIDGGKLKHLHLPGGNVKSSAAIALKEKVEDAIASGMSSKEIEQLIKSSSKASA